jgi:DNA-binding MarR family transcriptional regulator
VDRRLVALRLTPAGKELVTRVLPVAMQFQQEMLDRLGTAAKGLDTGLTVLLDGGK